MTNEENVEFTPLSELILTNGFLFGETMYDENTSKKALEIILGMDIEEVALVNKEQHLDVDGMHKGIRLDIYVKDKKGCIYNVEMQTENRYNIPKRSRHYQLVIDIKLLPAGETDYNKLNDTIIIYICTFDLFKQNRYIYEFENRCKQDLTHMLDSQQVLEFNSSKVRDIYNRSQKVKRNSQVAARYMRELVYEKELIEQGIMQERRTLIEKKLAKGQTIEQIAQALEMDNKEIEKIVKGILSTL